MSLSRELVVRKRYLHLPVKRGAPNRRMSFIVDAEPVAVPFLIASWLE